MKNVITQILEGEFHLDGSILDFSCSKIDLALESGQNHEGSFHIYGPLGLPTEGSVYTDNLWVELYTQAFAGKEAEIAFCFHLDKSVPGDSYHGIFTIVSNHGEYTIPYDVQIVPQEIESSLGPVKNLFHFTNLAKTNWLEALNLFYSPAFAELLNGQDQQYMNIYRGLSGYDIKGIAQSAMKNEQNMEEFLLAIRKKQKIEYLIGESQINIALPLEPTEYLLAITRNGWGYTNLHCQVEGDFLVCEKEIIRDEDYLANTYKLPYYVDREKLYQGRNFGHIRLYDANTDITIPVIVTKSDAEKRKGLRRNHDYKRNISMLMNHYIAFRTKQTNQSTWRKETEQIIDRMISASDKDLLPKLFRIQLLITENRLNEAGRLLNHADKLLSGYESKMPQLWCYYLYLTTLENREAQVTSRVASEVERFYAKEKGNFWIGWLLCYLKEEYVSNPVKKWAFLRELIHYGTNSPIIFVEAWQLLLKKPELLTRLDEFELRLLLFAARRKRITKELIPQIVYLIGKSKSYSRLYYQILAACYEVSNAKEVVQAICELLIKGENFGPAYFPWYLKGVMRDINVTKLYEYFVFSLDQEKEDEIPKQVLLYFVYQSEIDYHYQAYIYAYIHKNRDLYPEIYENYHGKIERFVLHQLGRARTGKWLAYLYKNFIVPEMVTAENASGLADILFTAKIEIIKENIREIIILYDKVNFEMKNHISGKVTQILLYGLDYQLFLVDAEGNRYSNPENYRLEKWLVPDQIGQMIAPLVNDRIGFDLWVCGHGDEIADVTRSNLLAYERVCLSDYLSSPYREAAFINLIRFYYHFDETSTLDRILGQLKTADIHRDDHEEIINIMVARGMYPEAYHWLKIGTQIMDAKLILRILREMVPDDIVSVDKVMLDLAFRSFVARKYDEKILHFLVCFYTGLSRTLRDIWLAGKNFGLDLFRLSERLLTQILYSGAFIGEQMEIFHDYSISGGKNDIVHAFMIQNAYEYFANDKITDVTIINQMIKFIDQGEQLNDICQLAFVKYFAENQDEINARVERNLVIFLQNLIDQNLHFAFFKKYIGILPIMDQFVDKTMIEYRTNPGGRVFIHYLLEDEPLEDVRKEGLEKLKSNPRYVVEPMVEMYEGIFVKQFLLFYGDNLTYYIAEEEDGEEYCTESGYLSAEDIADDLPGSRFGRINDIEIARKMQDNETVNALLTEFKQLDFLVNEIFHRF